MGREDRATPPSRIPWPPILIALTLVLGRGLDHVIGGFAFFASPPDAEILGGAIIALALANDLWCAWTLQRHETTILPHRATANLVTDGPYRFSRNPIYVSHVAVTFGLALLLRSTGIALLTPALAFALVKLSIEPEERHLESKFGSKFAAYKARTRRWL